MKRVRVSELIPGMVTATDVFNFNGKMVLPKGLVLTDRIITKLEMYSILSIQVEDNIQAARPSDVQKNEAKDSHSSVLKRNPEFQKFNEEYNQTVDSFKDTINNLIEKNSPVETKALLRNTMDLLSIASGPYSAMDMLHSMRQYDDLTFAG